MNAKEKINYISNWIGDYVKNMPVSAKSLVIGVSGGIDSSVSSTLSAMTGSVSYTHLTLPTICSV